MFLLFINLDHYNLRKIYTMIICYKFSAPIFHSYQRGFT